ncbi:MAG: hypothetical protein KC656_20320, partial [Myxococcales bacterium]|nr:hypothetical protein [Myxococcales bacterium]
MRALLAALVVGVALAARGALPPYDDAFFFVRFARNTLEHGAVAWNVADGPVYGNTSQLQQLVSLVAAVVAPTHVIALLRLVAAGCLIGTVALGRRGASTWLILGPVGLATLTTGMETATTLLLGTAFLAELDGRARTAWLGIGVAMLTLARPDAALLGISSLALARRWDALAVAAVGIGGIAAATTALYGSPLPTAFATKLAL